MTEIKESSSAIIDPTEWASLQLDTLCEQISTEQEELAKQSLEKFKNAEVLSVGNNNKISFPDITDGKEHYYKIYISKELFLNKFNTYQNSDIVNHSKRKILWIVEGVDECVPAVTQASSGSPSAPEQRTEIPHPKTFEEFRSELGPVKTDEAAIAEKLRSWGVAEQHLLYAKDIVTHFSKNHINNSDVWHSPFGGWGENRNVISDSLEEVYKILFPEKNNTVSFRYYANLADVAAVQPEQELEGQQILLNEKYADLLKMEWNDSHKSKLAAFIEYFIHTGGLSLMKEDVKKIESETITLQNPKITGLPAQNLKITKDENGIHFWATLTNGEAVPLSDLKKSEAIVAIGANENKKHG